MREFVSKKKKIIIDIILVLVVLIAVAGVSIAIFSAFNVLTFDGGIVFNAKIFDSFKNSWYGWIIFIAFQTIVTMLLSIVPGISMAFIVLCTNIYDKPWEAFLVSFISVMISSVIMYIIGRSGGYKLC